MGAQNVGLVLFLIRSGTHSVRFLCANVREVCLLAEIRRIESRRNIGTFLPRPSPIIPEIVTRPKLLCLICGRIAIGFDVEIPPLTAAADNLRLAVPQRIVEQTGGVSVDMGRQLFLKS